jgi:hypothetical protein
MPKHISLSDVMFNRVFVSSRFGFRFAIGIPIGVRPTECPSPAQSGLRAPGAPCPTHARARLPLVPLSHLIFFCAVTSLSLFHLSLSPRGALGFAVEIAGVWIPGGEFPPSPSLLSLSSPSLSSSPRGLSARARDIPVRAPAPPSAPTSRAALAPAPAPPSAPAPMPSRGRAHAAPSARPRPRRAPPPLRSAPSPPGEPLPSGPRPFPGDPPRSHPRALPAPRRAPRRVSPRPSPSLRRATPGRAPPRPRPSLVPLPQPHALCWVLARPNRTLGCALARAPAVPPAAPSRAPTRARARAPAASCPARLARFACPRHAQRALARATVVAFRLTFVLIYFNFSLVDVLRRALRRATVLLNLYLLMCCVTRFVARRFV